MNDLVAGALILAYAMAALFFLRFWRKTADRLFLIFSAAFWLMMAGRVAVVVKQSPDDYNYYLYLIRLAAYVLILYAIVAKNVTGGRRRVRKAE